MSGPGSTTSSPCASRVALVTGAAQGIGRGVALRLARDGYRIAACDLESQMEKLVALGNEISQLCETSEGGQCVGEDDADEAAKNAVRKGFLALSADVSKEDEVKAMVEKCVGTLGGLDVMVANAGIAIVKPLLESTTEEFDKVIAINLRGAMLCYKYAAIQMIKQGRGGRIIGASSMNGKAGAPNLAGYSASKFGIRGLTHTAALEWGKHGITVNAYAPARIVTPMLEEYDATVTGTTLGMQKSDFLEQMKGKTAVGYLAGPEEVASLVAYIASPEAHFITGQTLSVNGGAMVD